MKRNLISRTIAVLIFSLMGGFFSFNVAPPIYAQGPTQTIKEPPIIGDVWSLNLQNSYSLEPPAGTVQVEVIADWQWTGDPNQNQGNEVHDVVMPDGRKISCPDFGGETDDFGNPAPWQSCGSETFDWASDKQLDFTVNFTGDFEGCQQEQRTLHPNEGNNRIKERCEGSHNYRVQIIWHVKIEASLMIDLSCTGVRFYGNAGEPMDLTFTLSDGQSSSLKVDGAFDEMVTWNPIIQGKYGPHDISATAELNFGGQKISASESKTVTCGYSVSVDCNDAVATIEWQAATDATLRLSGTDVNGEAVDEEFGLNQGTGSETVNLDKANNQGQLDVNLTARIVVNGEEKAVDALTQNCSEFVPEYSVQVTANCSAATITWQADTNETLRVFGTDTNGAAVDKTYSLQVGSGMETLSWNAPTVFGQYSVNLTAEILVDGRDNPTFTFNQPFTCGYSVAVIGCDRAEATIKWNAATPATLRVFGNDVSGKPVNITENVKAGEGTRKIQLHTNRDTEQHDVKLTVEIGAKNFVQASHTFAGPCAPEKLTCRLIKTVDKNDDELYEPTAFGKGKDDQELDIAVWRQTNNFEFEPPHTLPIRVRWPKSAGQYWIQFEIMVGDRWLPPEDTCKLDKKNVIPPCYFGCQSQGKIGPVAFGTFTPRLEPGKDYFDLTRSLMFNAEYLSDDGQGELVYRFNGQEMPGVTTSIFNSGGYRQTNGDKSRGDIQLDDGVTKLVAYRYGQEKARVFQTRSTDQPRWIKPLDQPFEHKYDFEIELHGPPNSTDLLVYRDYATTITYDAQGVAVADLTYSDAGLVGVYQTHDSTSVANWVTVEALSSPGDQTASYRFAEIGLNHYRIVDQAGQVVAGPVSTSNITFQAVGGGSYLAQVAYPETSLYVGLYDDMKFKHPDYWTMPIDANKVMYHEFHVDYHREGNKIVIDALHLQNATVSVAQQFPYGRHDGITAGVNIFGIPNVSLVAYCQRPGYHEVAFWGGWENESYYLPQRALIINEDAANQWSEHDRRECADAALRINMELARQGLRTDHTFRHHGEESQGYQMAMQNVWSPYNLVELYPPHVGQVLKPGAVLPYYHAPEEVLFWGWDLDKGGLADGLDKDALQAHKASLGPIIYTDHTGIHPPERLNR